MPPHRRENDVTAIPELCQRMQALETTQQALAHILRGQPYVLIVDDRDGSMSYPLRTITNCHGARYESLLKEAYRCESSPSVKAPSSEA